MNNKKVLYLIIAVLFILAAVLAIMLVLPENEENSKAESDISQTFDISEISREISESSSEEISESVSAEISEESILPDISFVPAVSDEVSEPADTPSLPPEEETSTLDEVSEEPQVLITVPQITVPQVTGSAWDGSVSSGFEKGSGTQNDPYVISNPAQLAFFRDSVNSGNDYEGKYILLSQSIRISDIDGTTVPDTSDILWEGIGTEFNPFRGSFDGSANAVFGLYGDGLFVVIEGNVKDVIIADSYITSGGAVVATAMKNYEISDHDPIISGCAVINSTVCGIGGVVGYADGYSIISCSNFAPVNGNSEWVGGVVGEFAHGTMKNCYNVGSVSGGAMCGGIVGNGFNCSFEDCYNVGTVEGKKFSGGFAAVDYTSTYKSCGYLETVSEYAYSSADGAFVKNVKGILIFSNNDIG
ncbi:MAG: hypothetical protein IIW63_05740 [Clostridia bacterium]|nr:hypothetical protein [Clostridia bacterium]